MDLTLKHSEQKKDREVFTELSKEVRGMIESKPDWKERPREMLQKVLDKINETKPKLSILNTDETEREFAGFLREELRNSGKVLVSQMNNVQNFKILDGQSPRSTPVKLEIETWVDISTISHLMENPITTSSRGLAKLLEMPDKELAERVGSAEIVARVVFNEIINEVEAKKKQNQ